MKQTTAHQIKRAGAIAAGSLLLTLCGVVFMAVAAALGYIFGLVGDLINLI